MFNFISGTMKAKRRKFTAAFKAQVALSAIQERDSLAELSKRYEVHPNMISKWKREFMERSSEIFETKAPEVNFDGYSGHIVPLKTDVILRPDFPLPQIKRPI